MPTMIYAGQGPVIFGDPGASAGVLANQFVVGCGVSVLKLNISRETAEIKESCSGTRGTLVEYETSKTIEFELEMTSFEKKMLALALYGELATVAASTVTAEAMPTMAVGDLYHTRHPKVSAVVVKDSAGVPATLVAGTDYVLESGDYGRIKLLNLGSFVQPFTVDYSYAMRSNIKPFQSNGVTKGIMFDGISTVDQSRVRVYLPKLALNPTSDFDFLSEEATPLKLSGKLLVSDVLSSDPILGPYGVIDLL